VIFHFLKAMSHISNTTKMHSGYQNVKLTLINDPNVPLFGQMYNFLLFIIELGLCQSAWAAVKQGKSGRIEERNPLPPF